MIVDEAIFTENGQRLANASAADTVAFGQCGLGWELFARLISSVGNLIVERLINADKNRGIGLHAAYSLDCHTICTSTWQKRQKRTKNRKIIVYNSDG